MREPKPPRLSYLMSKPTVISFSMSVTFSLNLLSSYSFSSRRSSIMEPISYFVGVFNAILIYAYFMVNQSDFSFDDWSTRMARFFSKNEARRRGIDYARYNAIARRLRK